MMIRAHVTIQGQVQGVFFRAYTQEKAREIGVKGWVGNNSDGTVTVAAEGPENSVKQLIEWCHSGPSRGTSRCTASRAQVKKVDVIFETYTGEFEDFEIRY